MIQHYFKIAIRNLLKYKMQNAISIIGLSVGFTCFALAAFWIRYEMTFDNFHDGADRIYLIRAHTTDATGAISNSTPYPLVSYLRGNFPEIENVCGISTSTRNFRLDDKSETITTTSADSAFMQMFNIQIIKGNVDFLKKGSDIAVTEDFTRCYFPNQDPLGKEIEIAGRPCKIVAVVTGWSTHSNIPYSVLLPASHRDRWRDYSEHIFIRLRKGTDIAAFEKKISGVNLLDFEKESTLSTLTMTPITALRYSDYLHADEVTINFNYILYFSIAGGLVIVCSLFNYLTLFISRLRMRGREMALRKVNGASNTSLFAQLSVEFLFMLFAAFLVGMLFIELSTRQFIEFTQISDDVHLYLESVIYLLVVIALAFGISQIPLYYFRRQTLHNSIHHTTAGKTRNLFRKSGIIVQLIISLGFIFCTCVTIKQLYFLKNTDLEIQRHNIGSVAIWMKGDINQWTDKIAALPMVTETLPPHYFPIIPTGPMEYIEINGWDGLDKITDQPIQIGSLPAEEEFFRFYDLQLAEGEWVSSEKHTQEQVVINETAAKMFGWKKPLGKKYFSEFEGHRTYFTVIGVVKDFQYLPPTVAPQALSFVTSHTQKYNWFRASILFKFKEGSWNECKAAIEKMYQEDFPSSYMRLFSEEEEYNKYLRSENALMQLLGAVSVICVIISIFGIFSSVTLSCEQRRKEIAIRKVNGATVKNILQMFFKEYFLLVVLASLVAFPIGYVIMKSWTETYNRQTDIDAWLYLGIFAGVCLIVFLCIGWRVLKAARQNPSEVVKSE